MVEIRKGCRDIGVLTVSFSAINLIGIFVVFRLLNNSLAPDPVFAKQIKGALVTVALFITVINLLLGYLSMLKYKHSPSVKSYNTAVSCIILIGLILLALCSYLLFNYIYSLEHQLISSGGAWSFSFSTCR
ncbi:hypothetical protein DCCM_0055 [Desulfocucumis palustris]|uniref:Uncharacterized protein n=1 Tax=Desulfocucumis palustris TaxID=1898651 RepID=A0A2L2XDH0_9FIRM|nr:hypothetical protein [Desulfocucumis palustris]GBF31871.1 hypothetical protein DCCM_0055 [Desulfocucumis palustris]